MREKRSKLLLPVEHELSDSMVDAGWRVSSEQSVTHSCVGEFVYDLRNDFYAVAFFPWFGYQGSAVLNVLARIALQYRPAQRILTSFTGSPVCGLVLRKRAESVKISADGEIRDAVRRLVEFTSEQIFTLGTLNIDRLIEMLRERDAVTYVKSMMPVYARDVTEHDAGKHEYPDSRDELVPALLVAADRYDDARRLLDKSEINEESECVSYHRRRFVRQLRRIIDGRGRPNYPDTPPAWPVSRIEQTIASGNKKKVRPAMRQMYAERQALDAVRAVRQDDTRDRLRLLLEDELEARQLYLPAADVVDMVNVLYVEQQRGGTLKLLLSVVKNVSNSVASIVKAAPDGDGGLLSPAWRILPERAGYPIWATHDEWAQVDLYDHVGGWLMRELQSPTSARVKTQEIKVWLAWVPTTKTQGLDVNQLGVHIGITRVGRLASCYESFFVKPIEAAAERDEDPWTLARLRVVSSDQPPILEVGIPIV